MVFICPQSTVDKLEKEKMPRKGGRWWFSWRRRDFPAEEVGGHGSGGGASTGWRPSSDGYSSYSAVPRGRKPQPGRSRGELDLLVALQLGPGAWGLGRGTVPFPSHGSLSLPKHFFFLRHVPTSQMGKLGPRDTSNVPQLGNGRAGRDAQIRGCDVEEG